MPVERTDSAPFDRPTLAQARTITRGGAKTFGHSVAVRTQDRNTHATRGREQESNLPGAAEQPQPALKAGRPTGAASLPSLSIRAAANWAMKAGSSSGSRQRQSSHSRPWAIRPITGRGRLRSRADSNSGHCPPPSPRCDGSRSTGSAPEPIWLRHGTQLPPGVRRRSSAARGQRAAWRRIASADRVSSRSVGSSLGQPRRDRGRAAASAPAPPAAPCPDAAPASADWR